MDADADYVEKKRPRLTRNRPKKQKKEFQNAVKQALDDISDLSISEINSDSQRSLNGVSRASIGHRTTEKTTATRASLNKAKNNLRNFSTAMDIMDSSSPSQIGAHNSSIISRARDSVVIDRGAKNDSIVMDQARHDSQIFNGEEDLEKDEVNIMNSSGDTDKIVSQIEKELTHSPMRKIPLTDLPPTQIGSVERPSSAAEEPDVRKLRLKPFKGFNEIKNDLRASKDFSNKGSSKTHKTHS